jgi:phage tail tape-measure protein
MLEQLREVAGMGGPAASLANEMLVLTEQFQQGQLSREDFNYLLQQIAEVRAAQDLSNDEQACRWIVQAATTLASLPL